MFTKFTKCMFRAMQMLLLCSNSIASASAVINATAAESSYPKPLPCTGDGCTSITVSIQDFNVIQHQDGTYFRVSKSNTIGVGLSLASSPFINGPWTPRNPILGPDTTLLCPPAVANRSNTHLWTPELHYINSIYYLYYSVFNNQHSPGFDICVATSPNMNDDTWTDHGSVGVPPAPGAHTYAAIDQNILTDESDPYAEDASHSLVWGSFNAALYGMPLFASNPLRVSTSQKPQPVIQDQPVAVPDPTGFHGSNRTEGSFQWKAGPSAGTGQGWYYYFYSRGSCCATVKEYAYVTEVCRAKSAQGPYVDRDGKDCAGDKDGDTNGSGTLLLQSSFPDKDGRYEVLAPGSVGIVETTQGLIMTYQYKNQTAPEPVGITLYYGHNYLKFDGQGWPYLSATP